METGLQTQGSEKQGHTSEGRVPAQHTGNPSLSANHKSSMVLHTCNPSALLQVDDLWYLKLGASKGF